MTVTSFLKEADGSFSWGRIAACFTMASAIWALVLVVLHTHALPDPITLGGLAAWGSHPYVINKGITAGAEIIRPGSADKF